MTQFTIDRSKWRTGPCTNHEVYGATELLNEQGYMCCLGFYCKQLGNFEDSDMLGKRTPECLDNVKNSNDHVKKLVSIDENELFTEISDNLLASELMGINDSDDLTTEEREREIKHLFKFIDVDVVFTNEYKS